MTYGMRNAVAGQCNVTFEAVLGHGQTELVDFAAFVAVKRNRKSMSAFL